MAARLMECVRYSYNIRTNNSHRRRRVDDRREFCRTSRSRNFHGSLFASVFLHPLYPFDGHVVLGVESGEVDDVGCG